MTPLAITATVCLAAAAILAAHARPGRCLMHTIETPAADLIPAAAGQNPFYSRAWACWATAVIGSFAALETAAIVRAPGHGTLTAQLRRQRALSAACIAAFGVWAVHHIAWQGAEK